MKRKLVRLARCAVVCSLVLATMLTLSGLPPMDGKSPGDVDDTDLAEVGIDGRQRTTRAAEAADPGGTSRRLTPEPRRSSTEQSLPPSEGYNLANRLKKRCVGYSRQQQQKQEAVFSSYRTGNLDICVIWKVGTTFIRRLFMMKNEFRYRSFVNPYMIYFGEDYMPRASIRTNDSIKRLMFVRDPYQRLMSVYVDKIVAPNPIYWKIFGVPAKRAIRKNNTLQNGSECGHDLTFAEFVRFVVLVLDPAVYARPAGPDGHFNTQSEMCRPCAIDYDFVGKMETFAQDSLEMIRQMRLSNDTVDLLTNQGIDLREEDALLDSCNQPFDSMFKGGYPKCITFHEALQRAWKKMQMRGLIGPVKFALTEEQSKNLSQMEFENMAREARNLHTYKERQHFKRGHFKKLYSSVARRDLERLLVIYADDFRLFEYSKRPDTIFKQTLP